MPGILDFSAQPESDTQSPWLQGILGLLSGLNPMGSAQAAEPPKRAIPESNVEMGDRAAQLGLQGAGQRGGFGRATNLDFLRPAFDQVRAEQGGKISTVHIGDLIQRSNLPPSQVKDILREAASRGDVQLGFGNRARSALSPAQAKGIMKIGDDEYAVVTFK